MGSWREPGEVDHITVMRLGSNVWEYQRVPGKDAWVKASWRNSKTWNDQSMTTDELLAMLRASVLVDDS